MNPPYQRRSVWNQSYKDEFIDTVLMDYPAPAIFLYEEISPAGASVYQVVDGKQRLMSVFDFASGAFPVSESSPVDRLRGAYFNSLPVDEKTEFWTYQFPVEYLPTNEETFINEVFERINKNVARLSRQELRHARLSGVFISAAEELAIEMLTVLPEGFPRVEGQAKRQMKEVELVAGLLLYLDDGAIHSYSQEELDAEFSDRDTSWEAGTRVGIRFREVIAFIAAMIRATSALQRTRLRNQTDFYTFFTAVEESIRSEQVEPRLASVALLEFIDAIEDESRRADDAELSAYYAATRSNSNDQGQRLKRHEILKKVLLASQRDHSISDKVEVPVG
ncbi:MAG: DUF262 domain-containing protein [Bryobacteraceae bacterium]